MAIKKMFTDIRNSFMDCLDDQKNPNGRLAAIYKEEAAKTALWISERVANKKKYFMDETGRTREVIKQGWKVDFPFVEFDNLDYIDKVARKLGRTRKSRHNTRSYPPYYRFLLEGWGNLGGRRSDPRDTSEGYELAYIVQRGRSGQISITSPFNKNVGKSLRLIETIRHPGREARNWYLDLKPRYEEYFQKGIAKRNKAYFKSFGIKI